MYNAVTNSVVCYNTDMSVAIVYFQMQSRRTIFFFLPVDFILVFNLEGYLRFRKILSNTDFNDIKPDGRRPFAFETNHLSSTF